MSETSISVTPGTGANVATITDASTNERQVVVLGAGDGTTTINDGSPANPLNSKITDGTNSTNILKSDGTAAGQNAQLVGGTGYTTGTISLSAGTQATSWYDMLNYAWVSVEVLTNTTPATLTFQTSGDASETIVTTTAMVASTATGFGSQPVATSTSAASGNFHGSRTGRYFRISSNLAGGNTATLVLTFYTNASAFPVTNTVVNSNSATGSAVPANAFYMGVKDSSGNLIGPTTYSFNGDGGSGNNFLAIATGDYNQAAVATSIDRHRNNTTGVVIAAGATATNAGVTTTTYNASRAVIILNVSAFTSGTITVTINGVTSSGYTYPILVSAAIGATGVTPLRIFPGATASANAVANDMVPRSLQVVTTGTFSLTYGIDYELSV